MALVKIQPNASGGVNSDSIDALGGGGGGGLMKGNETVSGGQDEEDNSMSIKSISQCYFAGKDTAVMLSTSDPLRKLAVAASTSSTILPTATTKSASTSSISLLSTTTKVMSLTSDGYDGVGGGGQSSNTNGPTALSMAPIPIALTATAGAAAAAPQMTSALPATKLLTDDGGMLMGDGGKSRLDLGGADSKASLGGNGGGGSDIQLHLQSMFYLLRSEETLKMAVKLESARAGRTRYLVVVSRSIKHRCKVQFSGANGNDGDADPTSCVSEAQSANEPTNSRTLSATSLTTCKSRSVVAAAADADIATAVVVLGSGVSKYGNDEPVHNKLTDNLSSENVNDILMKSSDKEDDGDDDDEEIEGAELEVGEVTVLKNKSNSTMSIGEEDDDDQEVTCINDSPPDKGDANGEAAECNLVDNLYLSSNNNNNNIEKNSICSSSSSSGSCNNSVVDLASKERKQDDQEDDPGKTAGLEKCFCDGGRPCVEDDEEESCLLGIDCNDKSTVGLVLRIYADTSIRLDGDGGFSVSVCGRTHIFKPVSVQAMWSALQTLHKVSSKARESNYFAGGPSHHWASYYEEHIESDQSCINEWFAMDSLESRRPPSPDTIRNKPTAREETEVVIRTALKEIMMSVDLDEVTSKFIRGRLEEHLDMDLGEYKSFIDEEMLVILGQMDAPTEIFEHVYLGSEWNASNLEELQRNGVGHILNVTREIDNFFPGMFDYFNIRVYDDETTDLLKHWDNTFKYISKARKQGSKVLVHCKMGVSRSASVVIAYAMKAYNWDFERALKHVKAKRNCIKPNKSFVTQLETYQGMLYAMRNKEKLQRSKSEISLAHSSTKDARLLPGSEPTPLIQALSGNQVRNYQYNTYRRYASTKEQKRQLRVEQQTLTDFLNERRQQNGENNVNNNTEVNQSIENNKLFMENLNNIVMLKQQQQRRNIIRSSVEGSGGEKKKKVRKRPRSWSSTQTQSIDVFLSQQPKPVESHDFARPTKKQQSQSLENIIVAEADKFCVTPSRCWRMNRSTKTVRVPCSNGQNYSVSQNQVVHLTPESHKNFLAANASNGVFSVGGAKSNVPFSERKGVSAVKMIINELESSAVNPAPQTSADNFEAVLRQCKSNSLGRSQRDKKAMSLSFVNCLPGVKLLDNSERTEEITTALVVSDKKNVSKLIIKCDSTSYFPVTVNSEEAATDKSSAVTISHTNSESQTNAKLKVQPDSDAFSHKVDRVFEREERKQSRISTQGGQPHVITMTVSPSLQQSNSQKDFLISRQSSWSSVDSACVCGYPSESNLRELPSRHSSWGSGDTSRTTPSRNSSWGSYDMRTNPPYQPKDTQGEGGEGEKDDIPWHPGTVRRTKEKIEEMEKNHQIPVSGGGGGGAGERKKSFFTSSSRSLNEESRSKISKISLDQLSVSAPSSTSSSSTASNCSTCSNYTAINVGLESNQDEDDDNVQPTAGVGIVQNLKMNFELKAQEEDGTKPQKPLARSLPSSPIALHMSVDDKKNALFPSSVNSSKSTSSEEDETVERRVEKKNVKNLVGKYETTKMRPVSDPRSPVKATRQRPKSTIIPDRRSSSLILSQTSSTSPSSPATRKHSSFNFNLLSSTLAKPLMINHNKIIMKTNNFNNYNNTSSTTNHINSNGVYTDGGVAVKKGCSVSVSPRPPVPPAATNLALVTNTKNILGNKLNIGSGGFSGKMLYKKTQPQQQGKTHPLSKLNSNSFKQH